MVHTVGLEAFFHKALSNHYVGRMIEWADNRHIVGDVQVDPFDEGEISVIFRNTKKEIIAVCRGWDVNLPQIVQDNLTEQDWYDILNCLAAEGKHDLSRKLGKFVKIPF